MSVRSLGRLTLDLVLETGNFLGPMDKASRSTKKQMKDISVSIKQAATAVTAVAAASGAAATALVAYTNNAAQNARQLKNQAQLANTTVQEFQRMSYGVREVGIEEEKLADILKDVNDRVGDFLREGGGPMASFFENVAPKIGLTAEAFKGLSGPEALQLYYDSLERANVSQQEMTTYLEEMASDTTALIPLLRNGGERLGEMADEADRLGIVMSDLQVAQLDEFAAQFDRSAAAISGISNALAAELAPYLSVTVDYLFDAAEGADGFRDSMSGAVFDSVAWITQLVDEILILDQNVQIATARMSAGFADFAQEAWGSVSWLIDTALAGFNNLISGMNAIPGFTDLDLIETTAGGSDFMQGFRDRAAEANTELSALSAELFEMQNSRGPGASFLEDVQEKIEQIRKTAERDGGALSGLGGGSGTRKADEATAKATDAINKQVAALEQQAATLGMAEDAAELYALAQEGATDPQLAAARAALETISAYEESEKAAEDYQSLLADLRTTEEELTAQMKDRMAVLDAANVSADEYAEAMDKISAATVEDAPEFSGIDASVGGASGELMRVAEAEKELEEWHSRQIEMQDELLRTKEINEQTHADRIAEINQQNNDRLASIQDSYKVSTLAMFSSLTGDAADMMGQLAGEGSDAYKALFLASKAAAIAQTMVSTEVAAAKALELGPIAGIPASSLVRGLGYASVGMIAAQTVSGMAHDGIDSVPETGTWLLEKGERVTTAETSAKLDATLARLERDTEPQGGSGGVSIPVSITVEARSGVSDEESRRQGQQMGKAFRNEVLKIMQNEKRQGGLLAK